MNALPLPSELCSKVEYHAVSGWYASYSRQHNKNTAIEVELSTSGSVSLFTWETIYFEDGTGEGERKLAKGAVSGMLHDFVLCDDVEEFSCVRGLFEGKYTVFRENNGALLITITNLYTLTNRSIDDIKFEINTKDWTMRLRGGSLSALGGSIPETMPTFKMCVPAALEPTHDDVNGANDMNRLNEDDFPSMDELALSESEINFYEFS